MSFLLSLFTTLALSATQAPKGSAETILAKFQQTWDNTATYQATFKQTVFSKQMGTSDLSEGELYVEKPSRLRWDTRSEGSLQILNGKTLTNVQTNARRKNRVVDIYRDVSKVLGSAPLKFLSGKAKFKDIYQIKLIAQTPEVAEMKLTPKGKGEDSLVVAVDKKSFFLKSLTTESVDSRVKIEFFDIKTNVKLDEKLFAFQPEAKDIVHQE